MQFSNGKNNFFQKEKKEKNYKFAAKIIAPATISAILI